MNLKIFEYVHVTFIRWIKTEILKFKIVLFLALNHHIKSIEITRLISGLISAKNKHSWYQLFAVLIFTLDEDLLRLLNITRKYIKNNLPLIKHVTRKVVEAQVSSS